MSDNLFRLAIVLNIFFGIYIWWSSKRRTRLLKENHLGHTVEIIKKDIADFKEDVNVKFDNFEKSITKEMKASWHRIDEYVKLTNEQDKILARYDERINHLEKSVNNN